MKNIIFIVSLFVIQQSKAQNLVAHYPLNGNALEMVGGLNGTLQGGPTPTTDRFSNPNGAMLFDGINDFISVAGSPINSATSMSMSFWMYSSLNTQSAEPVLLGVDDCIGGPSLNGYSVYTGGFGPTSAFLGNGLTIAVSNVAFLSSSATFSGIGQWDFIVAQKNGSTFELYKNGVLAMSGTAAMQGIPSFVRIGSATNCRFFAGAVDDVQIYDAPLSQSQISGLYNMQAPLPLQFTEVDVRACHEHACLSWQTQSELNVSHYVIQKSYDGSSFEELGFILTKGEGNNNYTYTDINTLLNTRNYYRIQSVDIDGTISYSKVVALMPQNFDFNFYPNPANSYIEFSGTQNIVEVTLLDMRGKIILKSDSKTRIQLPSLPKGIYMLQLKSSSGTEMKRIQIQ